jgi:serine/threonine-protein kinase
MQQHDHTTQTTAAPPPPPRQHTREMTRGPDDWERSVSASAPSQFAGIDIDDLEWARQRGRRVTLFWTIGILTLTGLVAAGAWTLGSNLPGLI